MMQSFLPLLPLIALFGVIIYLSAKQQKTYRAHVDQVNTINREILESNQEMIMVLKDIRKLLRDQN